MKRTSSASDEVVIRRDPAQMQVGIAGSFFDFILNTVAAPHVADIGCVHRIERIKRDGTLCATEGAFSLCMASPHPSPERGLWG